VPVGRCERVSEERVCSPDARVEEADSGRGIVARLDALPQVVDEIPLILGVEIADGVEELAFADLRYRHRGGGERL
jgi:hypothetical protein